MNLLSARKLHDFGDFEHVQFNTYWSYWARSKRQFNDSMSAQFYDLLSARKWTRFGRFVRAQFNTNWSNWARSKRQFPVTIHSSNILRTPGPTKYITAHISSGDLADLHIVDVISLFHFQIFLMDHVSVSWDVFSQPSKVELIRNDGLFTMQSQRHIATWHTWW